MKVLFFDTETTGKANFNIAPEADVQPRIVQLAALLCGIDRTEIAMMNTIIKTTADIPQEASAIHGITNVFAKEFGVPLFFALQMFWSLARQADVLVAHNIDFDLFILEGEARRMVTDTYVKSKYCTMKAMAPICKIPGRYDDFKWPRLIEAYQYAFGKEFDGAHDALADVRACKEIYYWLKDRVAPIPKPVIPPADPRILASEMRKAADS